MRCSNHFMVQAYRLSNHTRNPQRALQTMRRSMNDTISLLKAIYVLDMLEKMVRLGLTLTTVNALSTSLCRGLRGDKHMTISEKVMKSQITPLVSVCKKNFHPDEHLVYHRSFYMRFSSRFQTFWLYLFGPSIVSKAGKALLMSQKKWRRRQLLTCCTLN